MTTQDKKQFVLDNIAKFKQFVDNKEGIFKTRFIGHEGISAFMAVDILNETEMDGVDKEIIFKLIALHGSLFHYIKADSTVKGDIVDTFAGNRELLDKLVDQVKADSMGRFHNNNKMSNAVFGPDLKEIFQDSINRVPYDVFPIQNTGAPQLTVLVGPPCSRKSWEASRVIEAKKAEIAINIAKEFLEGEKMG